MMSINNLQTSHLFTVRVWLEQLGDGDVETRFQTKHVTSGESRLFRNGEQLLTYLHSKAYEAGKEGILEESSE
jgi:hypothetical protein